jgi:hypothetical protein
VRTAPRAQAPPVQEFGFVGAAETLARSFPLRNAGDTPVAFAWSVASPYTMSPQLAASHPAKP